MTGVLGGLSELLPHDPSARPWCSIPPVWYGCERMALPFARGTDPWPGRLAIGCQIVAAPLLSGPSKPGIDPRRRLCRAGARDEFEVLQKRRGPAARPHGLGDPACVPGTAKLDE